jgi:hypothetical protein
LNGEFIYRVKKNIEQGYSYTALIRVKYGKNQSYMVGANIGFKYDDDDNKNNLIALLVNTRDNLQVFFDETRSGQKLAKYDMQIDYF